MRRWLLSPLIIVSAVCLLGPALAKEDPASVLRVIDGDTIEVSISGTVEKVRLIGVNTPESLDPRKPVEFFGKEASEFTRKLVEGRKVVLRGELGGQDRDKYGLLLRYVYLEDGTLVNAEIIKQGYGHAYVNYPFSYMEEFRAHERQAREKGLGLWGGKDGKPEPGKSRAPTEERFIGSVKSSKYHLPECVWAQMLSPTRLVTFTSAEEAQTRGYVPCEVCNPLGSSGGTGADRANSRALTPNVFTFYLSLVDRKVRDAWEKPTLPRPHEGEETLTSVVTLTLSSSGRVTSLQLTRPSGHEALDRSALRAVRNAEPFPSFPYQLGRDTLTINLEFVLAPDAE